MAKHFIQIEEDGRWNKFHRGNLLLSNTTNREETVSTATIAKEPCCDKHCLFQKYTLDVATHHVYKCLQEVSLLDFDGKKLFLRAKIENSCIVGLSPCGYFKMEWKIGNIPHQTHVCKDVFVRCYQTTRNCVEDICASIKRGESAVPSTAFGDRTNIGYQDRKGTISKLIKLCSNHKITLTHAQIASVNIPNTVLSLQCYSWMKFYFNLVGDCEPNTDGEIHLEPSSVVEIYIEYITEQRMHNLKFLEGTQFRDMWKTCFPYVKMREYKAVSGKCYTCAALSNMRKKYGDKVRREYLTQLFQLHRTAYMGERMEYMTRSNVALNQPSEYLSIVTDGMAQSHCVLPWLANLNPFGATLSQHFQGVLAHGRFIRMFRTYHNLSNTANLQIHTLLLSLEDVFVKEGRLPNTCYFQIDGGSENTAKIVLIICELIIAKGLTKRIVLTRLMVGHTHCDIDAVFGRLWKYNIRDRHLLTPDAYKEAVIKSCSSEATPAEVKDLFVIPDYTDYFEGCVDPKFANYRKTKDTQLQFVFQSVPRSDLFPLGVKTTYKAYAAEQVVEIVKSPAQNEVPVDDDDDHQELLLANPLNDIRLCPQLCHTKFYPEEINGVQPEGMYILQSDPTISVLPNKRLRPQEFIAGSRAKFDLTMRKVVREYANEREVLESWRNFERNDIPATDDVHQYIESHHGAMYIPFKDILFSGGARQNVENDDTHPPYRNPCDLSQLPEVRSTASVKWSQRGQKRKAIPPREALSNPNDNTAGISVKASSNSNNNSKNNKKSSSSIKKNSGKNKSDDDSVVSGSEASALSNNSRPITKKVRHRRTAARTSSAIKKNSGKNKSDDDSVVSGSETSVITDRCSMIKKVPRRSTSSKNKVNNRSSQSGDQEDQASDSASDDNTEDTNSINGSSGKESDDDGLNVNEDSFDYNDEEYSTDVEDLDVNAYYIKKRNVEVKRFGSALLYVGKKFVVNQPKASASNAQSSLFPSLQSGKIVAVVCKKSDESCTLYFKVYDPEKHRVVPTNKSEEWQYIECKDLMKSNKLINWNGGNPATLGKSLVGARIRRSFKVGKTEECFVGIVTQYLNMKQYKVQYEDDDVQIHSEKEIVKSLIYPAGLF